MAQICLKEQPCLDGAQKAPRRVLFVCTGNTCRSPMAAALLNDMCKTREPCSACPEGQACHIEARSAGLYAVQGAPITPLAAQALEEAGVVSVPPHDYRAHRASNITSEAVAWADDIVGLTGAHAMELMLRFPEAASKIRTLPMDIADPFGGDMEIYRQCLAQLRYALTLAFCTEEQA